jgi:hypothetical protein
MAIAETEEPDAAVSEPLPPESDPPGLGADLPEEDLSAALSGDDVESTDEDLAVAGATVDEPALELLPVESPVVEGRAEAASLSTPLRPGPGIIPRQVVRPPLETPSSSEPPDWDVAWEEPPSYDDEDAYEELPADAAFVFADDEPAADLVAPVGGSPEALDPATGDEPDPVISELAQPVVEDETEAGPAEEIAAAAIVEEEEDWPVVTTDEETGEREVLLDLGHLEFPQDLRDLVPTVDDDNGSEGTVEPDLELLFAGAPAPEGERSGLLGAVRSAFARNRGGTHEHQFVEAPGGIGIVRQICADCGYISIGVSD